MNTSRVLQLMGLLCASSPLWPATLQAQPLVTQVAAGSRHSCARLSDGSVRCWGLNSNGQLGDGTLTSRTSPVVVTGIASAGTVALGENYSCALLLDGTAQCWGQNADGQLGDGTTTRRPAPVSVGGITQSIALATGSAHACAILQDSSVECWGLNMDGQLGNGTVEDSSVPIPVTGLTGAVSLALGDAHSCAMLGDGTVRCWGWNGYGQLGNPSIALRSLTPVAVSGLSDVRAISAGLDHVCALLTSGGVRCWGYNGSGGLGDGTTTQRGTPVATTGIVNAIDISVGYDHSCARSSDGLLRCWGSNLSGELGDGTTGTDRLTPVLVQSAPAGARDIAAGESHTCALYAGAGTYCWGSNANGQLGNGTNTASATPKVVSGLVEVRPVPALGPLALSLLALSLLSMLGQAIRASSRAS